jgi:general secretion pathway protein C
MSMAIPTNSTDSRRLAMIVGGGLVLLLLAWWLTAPGDEPAAPAPTPAAPAPLPVATAAPATVAAPPAQPAPSTEGLRLFGLLGSGAIIGFPDGTQRLVRIGRDVLPGLTLVAVRQHNVLLRSGGGDIILDFGGVAAAPGAAAPGPAPAGQPAAEAALRDETLRYRLGLAPRMESGRVTGFTIRPGTSLPALQRAGLRPGDTIISVNGSRLDEERMLELAWTIANSDRTEFEYERGGRRLRAAVR